jgi:protein required for attachment to host cells
MKKDPIYILLADSARARLFTADSRLSEWQEQDFVYPAGRQPDRELNSDRSGYHGFEGKVSRHEEGRIRFASELAGWLESERGAGRMHRLFIAAPPRFLGVLKHELSDQCLRLLVGQLDRELIDETPEDIMARVRDSLMPD